MFFFFSCGPTLPTGNRKRPCTAGGCNCLARTGEICQWLSIAYRDSPVLPKHSSLFPEKQKITNYFLICVDNHVKTKTPEPEHGACTDKTRRTRCNEGQGSEHCPGGRMGCRGAVCGRRWVDSRDNNENCKLSVRATSVFCLLYRADWSLSFLTIVERGEHYLNQVTGVHYWLSRQAFIFLSSYFLLLQHLVCLRDFKLYLF